MHLWNLNRVNCNSLIGGGAGQAEGQLEGFPGQCIVSQNCRNPGMRWARYWWWPWPSPIPYSYLRASRSYLQGPQKPGVPVLKAWEGDSFKVAESPGGPISISFLSCLISSTGQATHNLWGHWQQRKLTRYLSPIGGGGRWSMSTLSYDIKKLDLSFGTPNLCSAISAPFFFWHSLL